MNDTRQQAHMRGIFARMLPDPDVPLDKFDRDERILLDVLAETYITQASVFADLMDEHSYVMVEVVERDVPRRVIALSLSASIFFLAEPDGQSKRRYRYSNIYGNQEIRPEGRCRIKGNLRVGKPIPEIDGRDVAGVEFKLSDYRGNVVLLCFWAHW